MQSADRTTTTTTRMRTRMSTRMKRKWGRTCGATRRFKSWEFARQPQKTCTQIIYNKNAKLSTRTQYIRAKTNTLKKGLKKQRHVENQKLSTLQRAKKTRTASSNNNNKRRNKRDKWQMKRTRRGKDLLHVCASVCVCVCVCVCSSCERRWATSSGLELGFSLDLCSHCRLHSTFIVRPLLQIKPE